MFHNILQLSEEQKKRAIKQFARSDKDAHEYSIIMIDISKEIAKQMKEICKNNIADEVLYTEDNKPGREDDAHITVKWGITTDDVTEFKKMMKEVNSFVIKFGKISLFEPDDKYDVVKIEVISRELHALNKKITNNFETEETHKEYKPHATLAYILPKRCPEALLSDCRLTGKTMKVTEVVFCDRKGKKTKLKLGDGT
jgi:2'-5' RNA ligase